MREREQMAGSAFLGEGPGIPAHTPVTVTAHHHASLQKRWGLPFLGGFSRVSKVRGFLIVLSCTTLLTAEHKTFDFVIFKTLSRSL